MFNILTKNQIKIMQVFTGNITRSFSIRGVATLLKKDHSLIFKSIKPLIENKVLLQTEENRLVLNYKENLSLLAYIESIRASEFLNRNKSLSLFLADVLALFENEFFVIFIFGSAVTKESPRDIDLCIILESDFENKEKAVRNISSNFSINLDLNIVTAKSIYEMAIIREQKNIFNEALNNHIVLAGFDNFFWMVKNARR